MNFHSEESPDEAIRGTNDDATVSRLQVSLTHQNVLVVEFYDNLGRIDPLCNSVTLLTPLFATLCVGPYADHRSSTEVN